MSIQAYGPDGTLWTAVADGGWRNGVGARMTDQEMEKAFIMAWKTLRWDYLDTFKRQWPCHGLPDSLHSVSFEFASNGDLVGIEAYADDESRLDSAEFDGPALLALSQDAARVGDDSD